MTEWQLQASTIKQKLSETGLCICAYAYSRKNPLGNVLCCNKNWYRYFGFNNAGSMLSMAAALQ